MIDALIAPAPFGDLSVARVDGARVSYHRQSPRPLHPRHQGGPAVSPSGHAILRRWQTTAPRPRKPPLAR